MLTASHHTLSLLPTDPPPWLSACAVSPTHLPSLHPVVVIIMPKRVGKYEIGKTLGEGSFGKVKYAVNVETGEAVAIKVSALQREVGEGRDRKKGWEGGMEGCGMDG